MAAPLTVEAEVDCDAPISAVYDQWLAVDEFPSFMEAIEEVHPVDDKHLHWVASVAGQRREWDSEIVEQHQDHVLAWKSPSGPTLGGKVQFEVLEPGRCRVIFTASYSPEMVVDKSPAGLSTLRSQLHADLTRFKRFIEERHHGRGQMVREAEGKAESRTEGDIEGAMRPNPVAEDIGMPADRKYKPKF